MAENKIVMKREKKKNGPLARRLAKYVNTNILKRGDRQRILTELNAEIKLSSINHVYYWIGAGQVPDYHATALETFLTSKGF